ncbi:hypothetical protein SAMN02745866_04095 [Alteromonadaceae bacterium Bs31]|nr:hypothetical protein SAMN02745866_04095 [Alteromonadaceae bacterium Bs31]
MSSFKEDKNIHNIAQVFAKEAFNFVRYNTRLKLNWEEYSVATVEKILGMIHDEMSKKGFIEMQIYSLSKDFGSFIGEVYRRHHGATWGLVTMNDNEFTGLQTKQGGLFWPWGKVESRLKNGAEDNVYHYYQGLVELAKQNASNT